MVYQKTRKPTAAEERLAYDIVEVRDLVCVKCRRGDIQRDHRKNRSQGGLTVASNLQLLCTTCHLWKTDHPAEALAEGLAVPGWGVAADFPARRWLPTQFGTYRQAWVLYDDEGGWVVISHIEAVVRGKGVIA
jgi:hypothetical protein